MTSIQGKLLIKNHETFFHLNDASLVKCMIGWEGTGVANRSHFIFVIKSKLRRERERERALSINI